MHTNVIPALVALGFMSLLLIYTLYKLFLEMPEFFTKMPLNDDKVYIACVIELHAFRGNQEIYQSNPIKGIRKAYIKARFAALYYDNFVIPKRDYYGVNYGLREVI